VIPALFIAVDGDERALAELFGSTISLLTLVKILNTEPTRKS